MNREKTDVDYPVELESQFIMRLPKEPAETLREALQSGDNFKNRLSIQLDSDMRHGEVRFDHWLLYGKVYDLPTIVESLKTVDRKSVYKTADICQIMLCKNDIDPSSTEDESQIKPKKKDPFKVDKKFLWPHGITPPTKNVRKRRFRKTLKKKSVEAPEIEKEVKRLLRADNEAVSVTWEVIAEDDESTSKPDTSIPKQEKAKGKKTHNIKTDTTKQLPSKVEDIFGGVLSDSDLEDENINVDVEDSRLSSFDDQFSESSFQASDRPVRQFTPSTYYSNEFTAEGTSDGQTFKYTQKPEIPIMISKPSSSQISHQSNEKGLKLQQLAEELEELKQRRQRTQLEIAGMENMTLRQRFQDVLQTLNKDIVYKEMEYQNLLKHK